MSEDYFDCSWYKLLTPRQMEVLLSLQAAQREQGNMQRLTMPVVSKLKLRRALKNKACRALPLMRFEMNILRVFMNTLRYSYYIAVPEDKNKGKQ